jgi:hypothetical protein
MVDVHTRRRQDPYFANGLAVAERELTVTSLTCMIDNTHA